MIPIHRASERRLSPTQLIREAKQIGLQQIDEEISALLRFLLNQPRTHVLEIGSAEGGTFYLWCRLFSGKKISLDDPSGNFGGIGMAKARLRKREFASCSKQVSVVLGDSHSMRAYHRVARILGNDKVDFLFIDGDHSILGVQLDYFMYREFVKPGGHIAFHDINQSRWHAEVGCLVGQFWSMLKGEKREFNSHHDWGGIGLLTVI